MADLAWSSAHDARDPAVVADLVEATCSPLSGGKVRPLVAVRRAGKTWALRSIEHARRPSGDVRFVDLSATSTLPKAAAASSLLLLDEPVKWLASPKAAEQLFDWFVALPPTCHVVLALTPAELASLHGFARGTAMCHPRSAVYLPVPLSDELARTAPGHNLSTVPWRWQSSFHLLRTWMQACADLRMWMQVHANDPAATKPSLAELATRRLDVDGRDVYLSAVFTDSLPLPKREVLHQLGRGEDVPEAARAELVDLGLVRGDSADGPWRIADPILAAALTPLRIHHISDVHVGDKAASTIDMKEDPTPSSRMTAVIGNTFVRDEYVTELRDLAKLGLGPHLVVISGDLVERAGEAALIAEARHWVDEVRDLVVANEHPCLHDGDPRVLLVGGNHDVDWSKASDPDPHARHRPFADAFHDLLHPHLELPVNERERACKTVVSYRQAKVAFWLLGSAELGGEQLDDPRFRAVFQFAERLAQEHDELARVDLEAHRPTQKRIDPGLVHHRVLEAAPPASVPVRIAVLHHPVTVLAGTAPEVASFNCLINAATVKATLRKKGYQLVLHGHVHHGALVTETSHDREDAALHIAAAPSLGSREVQEQHGYNQITLVRTLPVAGQVPQIRVRVERHTHGGKGAGWPSDGAVLTFDVPV